MKTDVEICADFYEWLDKTGYYKYAEKYEMTENPNGILCQKGYRAFCNWLTENGRQELIFEFEQSNKKL